MDKANKTIAEVYGADGKLKSLVVTDNAPEYKLYGGHVELGHSTFATAFESLLEQLTLTLKQLNRMPEKVEFKTHSRGILSWTAYFRNDALDKGVAV